MKELIISYDPLKVTLIQKSKLLKDLREDLRVSGTTLAKMEKREVISLSILLRVASYLDCNIEDIVTFKEVFKFEDSKLKALLDSKELSLDELIIRCGLDTAIKESILRGDDLGVKVAKRISSELGVSIEDLF